MKQTEERHVVVIAVKYLKLIVEHVLQVYSYFLNWIFISHFTSRIFQNRLSISFKLIAHGKIGHHGPPAASLVVQAPEVEADGYLFMKQMVELLVRGIVQRQRKWIAAPAQQVI